MPVFSKILTNSLFQRLVKTPNAANVCQTIARQMGGHGHKTIPMEPTRFQWHKFKDLVHFYTMVGLIPIAGIVFYTNVFIGEATLTETPEGYVPKHWEYHRHPITRFMARYIYASPQQDYEKFCHMMAEEDDKVAVRKLEADIREKMSERRDYQAYYYRPGVAKYHRVAKQAADDMEALEGDN